MHLLRRKDDGGWYVLEEWEQVSRGRCRLEEVHLLRCNDNRRRNVFQESIQNARYWRWYGVARARSHTRRDLTAQCYRKLHGYRSYDRRTQCQVRQMQHVDFHV
jgi:hypothetical protein